MFRPAKNDLIGSEKLGIGEQGASASGIDGQRGVDLAARKPIRDGCIHADRQVS